MDSLAAIIAKLQAQEEEGEQPTPVYPCKLPSLTLEGVAQAIKDGTCKNIIIMSGAGISVAAGIPDFRTPGTGLYDNLQKYNLPYPTAVFEIDYFHNNPKPFFTLAKELYPGCFKPTAAHYFVRLLHEKGLLTRVYTQNIDTLERIAGVPDEAIVEAHGSFATATCTRCKDKYSLEFVKDHVFKDTIPHCKTCDGVVKPDIVFFGESLPERFHSLVPKDFKQCDLLIVMGTSLAVHPFAGLVNRVSVETPRVLLNMEAVGLASKGDFIARLLGESTSGFRFDEPDNYRDVKKLGDVQASTLEFAKLLGWEQDLARLMALPIIDLASRSSSSTTTIKSTTTTTTATTTATTESSTAQVPTTVESSQTPEDEDATVPTSTTESQTTTESTVSDSTNASL